MTPPVPSRILALTASAEAASAVIRDGDRVVSREWVQSISARQRLFSVLPGLFEAAGVAPRDIELFVVDIGPGSFSGIRASVAAAAGLAQPHGRPVAGLSGPEAMAWDAAATAGAELTLGVTGDARRGMYWVATYRAGAGIPEPRLALNLVPADALGETLSTCDRILSPEAQRLESAFAGRPPPCPAWPPIAARPHAAALARLAQLTLAAGSPLPPPRPLYLHPPVTVAPRFA